MGRIFGPGFVHRELNNIASCNLTEVPADVYTAQILFDEVTGCYTSSAAEAYIVVYDLEAGAVAGKGSIASPEGAYKLVH